MHRYIFRLGDQQTSKSHPFIGNEVNYPFELRVGDFVVPGEKMLQEIQKLTGKSLKTTFWVGEVWHNIDQGDNHNALSVIVLVDSDPKEKFLREIIRDEVRSVLQENQK